ncbi:hypothetical protein NDU88_006606 [Pleurodeles waltl]|uniref:Immunoglobulin V-set domain-containing protein n=1 Tax=Pleurodeles waltl TaxID=8319 RepID=A0AAV7UPI4_PLEWA|nr:hypothetical protein NDU88_006606 [Pleurodeles waltl]
MGLFQTFIEILVPRVTLVLWEKDSKDASLLLHRCCHDGSPVERVSEDHSLHRLHAGEELIASTLQINFFSQRYHDRASVNVSRNLVLLYINKYGPLDKGTYGCRLQIDNDYTDKQVSTVKVMKDYLERCCGNSLLNSVPCLLFLLLLPLLQAVDIV